MSRVDYKPFVTTHHHKDVWESFSKEYEGSALLAKLSRSDFWDLINRFFTLVGENIVQEAGVYNPLGLDTRENIRLSRKKVNPNKMYVDFAHYKKTGEVAYHFNTHSNEYYYLFYWERFVKPSFTGNGVRRLYNFFPARGLKRSIAKSIKEGKFNFNIE